MRDYMIYALRFGASVSFRVRARSAVEACRLAVSRGCHTVQVYRDDV